MVRRGKRLSTGYPDNPEGVAPNPRQLRQPRLGKLVAEALRGQITSGALRDEDILAEFEELLQEFQVSKRKIIVGALEAVCSAHQPDWTRRASTSHSFPPAETRAAAARDDRG